MGPPVKKCARCMRTALSQHNLCQFGQAEGIVRLERLWVPTIYVESILYELGPGRPAAAIGAPARPGRQQVVMTSDKKPVQKARQACPWGQRTIVCASANSIA